MIEVRSRAGWASRIAAVVALVIVVIGAIVDLRTTAAAFLVAYASLVSLVLGILAMIMIADLTGATWFRAVLRYALAAISVLPALAGFGIVLLVARFLLYPSLRATGYLNPVFLAARTVVYWAAWLAIARSLRIAVRLQAQGEAARAARRFRATSAAGLVALALTMTFASFDWMMSLTPEWTSTIYGVYWWAGGMVAALALLGVVATRSHDLDDAAGTRLPKRDVSPLGKLLLTFILFWLYIGFAQYIVMWSGDLPREIDWYLPRTRGVWGAAALLLLVAGFALPFLGLLVRGIRGSARALAALGGLLLALHYVDTCWLVMPGLIHGAWWAPIVGLAMLAIVAGVAIRMRTRFAVE